MKLIMMMSLLILSTSYAQEQIVLNEKKLFELTKDRTPSLDAIEAKFNQAKTEFNSVESKYDPKFNLGANYLDTNEKALFSFAPVFSPTRTIYTSLEKQNKSGTTIGMQFSNDERSTTSGSLTKANTTTWTLGLNINLWKNFLGSLTKAEAESARLNFEKAKIENEIAQNNFNLNLRRIFWAIAANQEAIRISKGLLETAEIQAEDAKKRQRNSVADASEVAKYESQVASRKSSLLYLQYQREGLARQLKQEIPELMDKEILVDSAEFPQIISNVLECTGIISTLDKTPYDYTHFDEISKLLGSIQVEQVKIASKKDAMDVDLSMTYQVKGIDNPSSGSGSFSGSVDDYQDNDRSGYQVGLRMVIPFGESTKNIREASEVVAQKRYQAELDQLLAQMDSTHLRVRKSIGLLNEVVKNQKYNSAKLKERLAEMKKKYNQARISVNDLINDQDALLNSDLSIIQTQLEVANTLFDYFSIFNQTPCAFNRK